MGKKLVDDGITTIEGKSICNFYVRINVGKSECLSNVYIQLLLTEAF